MCILVFDNNIGKKLKFVGTPLGAQPGSKHFNVFLPSFIFHKDTLREGLLFRSIITPSKRMIKVKEKKEKTSCLRFMHGVITLSLSWLPLITLMGHFSASAGYL